MKEPFRCSACGKNLWVPEGAWGKRMRCPSCKAIFVAVPRGLTAGPRPAPHISRKIPQGPGVVERAAVLTEARPVALVGMEPGNGDIVGDNPFSDTRETPEIPPPPRKGPKEKAARSRYSARFREGKSVAGDCVILPFLCEEDPEAAKLIADNLRDILRTEDGFPEVVVSEDPFDRGRKATIADGMVSVTAKPAGSVTQASSEVSVSASILLTGGRENEACATATQQGGDLNAMRNGNLQTVAKKIAENTVLSALGYHHLKTDISGMATGALVLGILSAIPFLGFVLYAVALVMAILVLCHNRERKVKVGLRRAAWAIGLGGAITFVTIMVLAIAG
jgi:hypothetical protein